MSASSEYFGKVKALALRVLSASNPNALDENTLLLPVQYSWNEGSITRPSRTGPFISFDVSQNSTTYNSERLDVVCLKKNMADKFLSEHKELNSLLIYFQGDHALAYSGLRPLESYKLSVHEGFCINAKELTHVLTLTDDEERQMMFDSDPTYKARMSRLRKK
jgi:hypothetical protein